jgi:trafficking protein particle complex subunit 12
VAADPSATEDMKQMNAALLASAEGHWMEASDNLKAILENDSDNYVVCSSFKNICLWTTGLIDSFF